MTAAVAAQAVFTSTTLYLPAVANGDGLVALAPEAAPADDAVEAEISDESAPAEAAAVDGVTTTVTKYYFLGSQRVAMSIGGDLRYLHADHLGSTVMETYLNGTLRTDQKYYAFGSQRDSGPVLTDHKFTGQKLDGTGLYYYNARYYDPFIGQFISPDTIVPEPGSVMAYQRYMYTLGNPLKYSDPSGHYAIDELLTHFGVESFDEMTALFDEGGAYEGLDGWYDILRLANDGDGISAMDPIAGHTISGVFQRDGSGRIIIDMGGGQTVDESVFATYGGHGEVAGKEFNWGDYGLYSLSGQRNLVTLANIGNQEMYDRPCSTWDCRALYYDINSLVGSAIGDASLGVPPVAGAAKLYDGSATLAGFTHTRQQYAQGKATRVDLAVNGVTAVGSVIPVVGEITGAVQLGWDLLDPFHPF